MRCPICFHLLDGIKDHYICSNPDCVATDKKWFWEWSGKFCNGYLEKNELNYFYQSIPLALNSQMRQKDGRIYWLRQRKYCIRLKLPNNKGGAFMRFFKDQFTFLNLGFVKFSFGYRCNINDQGEFVWKPTIKIWYLRSGKWLVYIPGIKRFISDIKEFHKMRKKICLESVYEKELFLKQFENKNKDWWSILYKIYTNFFYKKEKEYVLALKELMR